MSPDQRRDDDPPVPGWDAVVVHNKRFRQVADRYPRRVAEAYGGDFKRAAADSDEAVAATVAAWERAHGGPALDWPAIGAAERGETWLDTGLPGSGSPGGGRLVVVEHCARRRRRHRLRQRRCHHANQFDQRHGPNLGFSAS